MNTSFTQHSLRRFLSGLPPSAVWGRAFRDICLGVVGGIVISALGLMLRLSPQSQDLSYSALAVVTAVTMIYQLWRLWPLDPLPVRLLIPVLSIAGVLGATSGHYSLSALALFALCTLPPSAGWGRVAATSAAIPLLLMSTVQTLALGGPSPLLLLGLAFPALIWWTPFQRTLIRLSPRVRAALSLTLTSLTFVLVAVSLAGL